MIGTNNLAVIPARSGSKGLENKNIRLLHGKPLLAYTIEAAKESMMFRDVFVSTDSELYAEIAIRCGADVPFLRTRELSTDTASSLDVAKEAVIKYQQVGREFDTVAILQPTSPLRRAKDIVEGYKTMHEKRARAVVAVCEVDHSPLWSNTLPDDRSLTTFLNSQVINIPRQSLPTYYRINGALYLVKTDYLMSTENIYEQDCYALIMSRAQSIDIDGLLDFEIAEVMLKYQGIV